MAETTEVPAQAPSANPMQATFQAWRQMNGPVVAAMAEMNTRLLDQMTRAGNEWNGFLTRRLKEDFATSQRLLECRTPQDVFSAYADFLARAQSQYLAELQHFTRLNQRFADETTRIMRERLDERTPKH